MSNDVAVVDCSSDDGDYYYSHLLRRVVRKPTPVLYDMIQRSRKEDIKVMDELISERCKTHPDDVNWIEGNDYSPKNIMKLKKMTNIGHDIFNYLNNKLVVLKPTDVMDVLQEHDVNDGVAMEITSFLYSRQEQLAVLSNYNFWRTCFDEDYHACHLIDDWISIDSNMLRHHEVMGNVMNSIDYCTKDCCALLVLHNAKILIELVTCRASSCYLLHAFIKKCLRNKCVCMNDDAMKVYLKILDITIEKYREKMYSIDEDGDNIFHFLAYELEYPDNGCCVEKWLSLLSKTIDRFPSYLLSIRNSDNEYTPYDYIHEEHFDEEWCDQVKELFRPR